MPDLAIPNSFINGTVINADDVNENFTAIQINSNLIWDILDGTTDFTANLTIDKTTPIFTLDSDANDTSTYRLQENGSDRAYFRYLGASDYAEFYNEVIDNYVRLLDTGEVKLESKNTAKLTLTPAGNVNISANGLEFGGTLAINASRNATLGTISGGTTTLTGDLTIQKATASAVINATSGNSQLIFRENGASMSVINYNVTTNAAVWDNSTANNSVILADDGSVTIDSQSTQDITLSPSGNVDISANNLEMSGTVRLRANGTYAPPTLAPASAANNSVYVNSSDSNKLYYKDDAGNSIDLESGGGGSESTTVSNVGAATGEVFKQLTGTDIELKTFAAGTGISVTNGASTITITNTGGGPAFSDADFVLQDNADATKQVAFQVSGVTTGTTRTLTVQNKSYTIADNADLANYLLLAGGTMTGDLTIDKSSATLNIDADTDSNPALVLKENGTSRGVFNYNATSNSLIWDNQAANNSIVLADSGSIIIDSQSSQDITLTPSGNVDISANSLEMGGTAVLTNARVLQNITQATVDNIGLNGNTISTSSGDLTLTPTTNVDISSGSLEMAGTVVLDTSRNATLGTISAGATTLTGNLEVDKANPSVIIDGDTDDTDIMLEFQENGSAKATIIYEGDNNKLIVTNSTGGQALSLNDDGTNSLSGLLTTTGDIVVDKASAAGISIDSGTDTNATLTFKENGASMAVLNYNATTNASIWDNSTANNSVILFDSGKITLDSQSTQDIELTPAGNVNITANGLEMGGTEIITSGRVLQSITQATVDNIGLNGNTISTSSGDLTLTPTTNVDISSGSLEMAGTAVLRTNGTYAPPAIAAVSAANNSIFVNSSDSNKLYYKDDGGSTIDLEAGGGSSEFADNVFRITDDGDSSKKIAFQASGITTGNTRTLTVLDKDYTIGDVQLAVANVFTANQEVDKTNPKIIIDGDTNDTDVTLEYQENGSAKATIAYEGDTNKLILTNATGSNTFSLNDAGTNSMTGALTTTGNITIDSAGSATLIIDSATSNDAVMSLYINGSVKSNLQYFVASSATLFNANTNNNYIACFDGGRVEIKATNTDYIYMNNGGVVVGSPTGGNKGAGTVNATAVYDDNVLLTDYVFEKYYLNRVFDERYKDYEMMSLEETIKFTREKYHLPTMTGREDWKRTGKKDIGTIVTQLWETVETQFLYIKELLERIKRLEGVTV